MRVNTNLECDFPCDDVEHNFTIPRINLNPERIKIVVVSEAPPLDEKDYYYACPDSFFQSTTCTAFEDAGYSLQNFEELVERGIYFTTAIKCPKKNYNVKAQTLKNCSMIIEKELSQFPNVSVIMCMGDFAIKCINYITKKRVGKRVIPQGPTYKLRSKDYIMDSILYVPSYTQTGPSFNIEKSKRNMIAEDIRKAMEHAKVSW